MPRLAVLGQPIAHSLSPAIHTAALEALGLAGEWSYEAIEVSPDGLEEHVRTMAAEGFAGANVTIPHKLVALRLADRASAAALAIGAANTLTFERDRILADNTDAQGVLDSLPLDPAGERALVLGAGGAARAAVWALVQAGAEVSIWNRTAAGAERLASEFEAVVATGDERLATSDYRLIVNATAVGMGGGSADDLDALRLDPASLYGEQVVVDLAYGDDETQLIAAAKAAGATAVDGREVLVLQAAASLRIWTGMDPPVEPMRRAAQERLRL
jgi:shikimate dehydrogenase